MKQAVEQGHIDAMFSLAMYFRGDEESGISKDSEQMLFYLKMAADSQMAKAQRMLGYAYKSGVDGASKNRLLSMHYFRLAADNGDKAAEIELSILAEEEAEEKMRQLESIPQDAAELYLLGVRYREGEGVERNQEEALRLFRLAADQGHPHALYFVACAYRDGGANCSIYIFGMIVTVCNVNADFVSQDYIEAARLFQLSADLRHEEAEYELAFCYYSGHGVTKDLKKVCVYVCVLSGG